MSDMKKVFLPIYQLFSSQQEPEAKREYSIFLIMIYFFAQRFLIRWECTPQILIRTLLTRSRQNKDLALHFLISDITEVIFLKYLEARKSCRCHDNVFLAKISWPLICIMATVIQHLLKSGKTGIYVKPGDFKTSNRGVYSKSRTLSTAGLTIH
jgi:hypothetical protein